MMHIIAVLGRTLVRRTKKDVVRMRRTNPSEETKGAERQRRIPDRFYSRRTSLANVRQLAESVLDGFISNFYDTNDDVYVDVVIMAGLQTLE